MTIKEAVKKSGTPIALSEASVESAEALIHKSEKVRYAVVANCSLDGGSKLYGALVITTHRIVFCASSPGEITRCQLLLKNCVGLGDITGGTNCSLKISGDTISIIVELNRDHLAALQMAILDAIADYPNQPPIDFSLIQ